MSDVPISDRQKRGQCRGCGRSYRLRLDGGLRRHFLAGSVCLGSLQPPSSTPLSGSEIGDETPFYAGVMFL